MHSFSEAESQEICRNLNRDKSIYVSGRWERLVLRLTYPIWRKMIAAVLCRLYERRVIDSSRLHIISALFDRTQLDSCVWLKK